MTAVKKMSTEQLEKELTARKQKEAEAHARAKKKYEDTRDRAIDKMVKRAASISWTLKAFKEDATRMMDEQQQQLAGYGKIRSNSKGGFRIVNSSDTMKIERKLDSNPVWDERCDKAVSMLKEYLVSNIKKRDQDLFEILMTFLEKNKKGDMRYESVMKLLQHEDKFADPRWKEGIKLLKDSYTTSFKKYYYIISTKDEKTGNWTSIQLNLSSI